MYNIGFLISEKENELRRALIIDDLIELNENERNHLYFQKGYGNVFNISDDEFIKIGCNILSKDEIIEKCSIICEPKIGDSLDLRKIKNKIIFGWVHATQNYDITQICIDNKLTVFAWEKMYKNNRHVFYKNNQIAGQASVLHAMLYYGKVYTGLNIAVLGRGNTAIGAIEILNKYGANVEIYPSRMEKMFIEEMGKFDVIVNCVLWDINRKDHIIYKKDLQKLKKGALIIDISCDHNGAIESSVPTTIENPVYKIDGIMHYVVDHTPSLLYKDSTKSISKEVIKYIKEFLEGNISNVLNNSLIIENGKIIDNEINIYQQRN